MNPRKKLRVAKPCAHCKSIFLPAKNWQQKYCSTECANKGKFGKPGTGKNKKKPVQPKTCPECRNKFFPRYASRSKTAIYCGRPCMLKGIAKRLRGRKRGSMPRKAYESGMVRPPMEPMRGPYITIQKFICHPPGG